MTPFNLSARQNKWLPSNVTDSIVESAIIVAALRLIIAPDHLDGRAGLEFLPGRLTAFEVDPVNARGATIPQGKTLLWLAEDLRLEDNLALTMATDPAFGDYAVVRTLPEARGRPRRTPNR